MKIRFLPPALARASLCAASLCVTSLCAASLCAAAAPITGGSSLPATAHRTQDGRTSSAWMLCDGLDSPQALVIGTPDPQGRSVITTLSKSRPGEYSYLAYIVGAGDPGAGNVYYPLSLHDGSSQSGGNGQNGSAQGSRDNLRTFNAGALPDPGRAYTPTLTSVALNGVTTTCRWVPGTRFLGVTERRSVLVTEADDGTLSYQTFDFSGFPQTPLSGGAAHSSAPSLSVRGGGLVAGGQGSVYTFSNNGYSYTLRVGNGAAGGATLSVAQNGKLIQTETFSAYQTGRRSAR